MKATHKGTCQVCGAVQKLPNGRLSKHGYTINYGWFQGTCNGSDYLPLEISCGLIAQAISNVSDSLAMNMAQIEKNKNIEITDLVPMKVFRRGGTYAQVKVDVVEEDGKFFAVWKNKYDKEERVQIRHWLSSPSILAHKRYYMEVEEHRLLKECREMAEYIRHQEAVLANWVAAPEKLIPVK